MKLTRNPTILLILLLSMVWLTSCGDSPTTPGNPGIQPEIINLPDSFEYQVSNIQTYSGTATYSWQNSGTTANIDISSLGSTGGAMLSIFDTNDTQVFSGSLIEDGTFVTESGINGTWTITIAYESFSGTVNFRAQKG